MKEIAELLGIHTEFVERDLAFYRGVGAGYLSHIGRYSESRSWEPIAYAATAFRRAGSHALLLDDAGLATKMFGNSAKCYEVLHRPYAAMMWTLARIPNRLSHLRRKAFSSSSLPKADMPPSNRFSWRNRCIRKRRGCSRATSRRLASSTGPLPNDSQRTQRFFDYASRNNGILPRATLASRLHWKRVQPPPEVEYYLLPFLNT